MIWVTGLWMHYNNAGSWITHAATLGALVSIVGIGDRRVRPEPDRPRAVVAAGG